MKYSFYCYGHPNIRAKHIRTIEFTKDNDLTERGDCIIGIGANFDSNELKKLSGKIRILVEIDSKEGLLQDTFRAVVNPKFESNHEIVFRKSLYPSPRTFGHFLNKGANRLDRNMVAILKNPQTKMKVTIQESRDLA